MDTTEIQTLRREVDTLRDENIALYNELTKQNKTLCEEILKLQKEIHDRTEFLHQAIRFFNSKNLDSYLDRFAGMQTAEFITENLLEAKSFKNRAQDGFCISDEYVKYILSQTENFEGGLFLEFGVFYGRSIALIACAKPDKIIYGFDSFEGLPENFRDLPKGKFTLNGKIPNIPLANIRLIKGWFNETLPEFVKAHREPCAFIHVDCDLYSSTKTIFDNLKNQIVPGTVIAFDEYFNIHGWKKYEYKAFMEFVAEKNFEFEYIARTDYEQVAVKIK